MINSKLYSVTLLALPLLVAIGCSDSSFSGSTGNGTKFQGAGAGGGTGDGTLGGGGDGTGGPNGPGGTNGPRGQGVPGLGDDDGTGDGGTFLDIEIEFTANKDDSKSDWGGTVITITNASNRERSYTYKYDTKTQTVTAPQMCPRVGNCMLGFDYSGLKGTAGNQSSNTVRRQTSRSRTINAHEVALGICDGQDCGNGEYHNIDDILFKITHSDPTKKIDVPGARLGPDASCTWEDWVADDNCGGW